MMEFTDDPSEEGRKVLRGKQDLCHDGEIRFTEHGYVASLQKKQLQLQQQSKAASDYISDLVARDQKVYSSPP